MFHLWNLLCFCGLLTGTSVALLSDLGSSLTSIVGQDLTVLKNELLGTVGNTVEGVLQELKVDVGALQNSSAFQLAQKKILGADNLLVDVLSKLQLKDGLLGVKITNSAILDAKLEPAADGIGVNVRFPITTNITVNLPLVEQLINMVVSLHLLTGVSIQINPQTNLGTVVVGECAVDPASISLSLLNRNIDLINRAVDSVTGILSNLVSSLIQNQLYFNHWLACRLHLPRMEEKDHCDITCWCVASVSTSLLHGNSL